MKQNIYRYSGIAFGCILASVLIGYIGSDNLFFWTRDNLINDKYYAESKEIIVTAANKSNNLVDEIVESEVNSRVNPSEKQFYLNQSERLRETLSKEYIKMADIVESRSSIILINDPSKFSPTKKFIYALREVATKSRRINSGLNKIYPQDIYLRKKSNVKKRDVFENMDFDARQKINELKELLKVKKSSNDFKQSALTIREMSEIYKEQAQIIAVQSPSFVEPTKEISDYLAELANDVEKGTIQQIPDDL
jgi:hypothetical protein